jgi:hypothetical protein
MGQDSRSSEVRIQTVEVRMKMVKGKRPQKSQDTEQDQGNTGWTGTGYRAAEGSGKAAERSGSRP